MDLKLLLGGLGCLLIALLIYRFLLKGETYSSKDNNWEGMTVGNYIGLWFSVISLIILGISFVCQSF
jgi:dolichyl-phosphate-mannose--protein O-mannosyl transferase